MMGRREQGQGQFFYAFDLDKVVPPDHLVRQIDGVLDLDWVHKELAPYYSRTGRPSIDPVLMIRMLIVGYVFAIRSERRLCAEVQVNLAYRWFCKLGIEDGIPDHSVFSRARHERFRQSDALRRVFEGVVAKCIAAGLVGGEGFSIDASLIRADAGKKKRVPGDQPIAWPQAEEASRAVREYLAALDVARNDEENGGDDGSLSGGGSRHKPPKEVSLTDPQAAWVARKNTDLRAGDVFGRWSLWAPSAFERSFTSARSVLAASHHPRQLRTPVSILGCALSHRPQSVDKRVMTVSGPTWRTPMPQSTLSTRHPRERELALRREMLMAIGQHLRTECELPQELPPQLTSKDKEDEPYADIVGTC
jgi:transposase